jgi:putative tryptophan/tyrosine transport system substrate-binding protein
MQFDQLRRRHFITLLGGAAAWPLATRAQQAAIPMVGYLGSTTPDSHVYADVVRALRLGLSQTGYDEGRNVAIEYRSVEGHYEQLVELAADLVRRRVAVIVSMGAVPVTLAAKAATTTIPIVFGVGSDPVQLGLVPRLNRPGGNLTGVYNLNTEILPKRLELMHEFLPMATSFALLLNPTNPAAESQLRESQGAARILGLQLLVLHASSDREIDAAFETLDQKRPAGLVIAGDGVFVSRSEQLASLTLHYGVPTIFQFREFAAAGGLMSYGTSVTEQYLIGGRYAGRILKGEKAADLPVQQVTKIELIINLKTAKALGVTIPLPLRGRADEVIE